MDLSNEARLDFINSTLPEELLQEAADYLERGEPPGEFLSAVLAWDDKARKMPYARHIKACEKFIDEHFPKGCYGSHEIVDAWCARRAVA
jgi:hypothetical protein